MKNTNITDKTINLLKRHYYIHIIVLAALFLLILFRITPLFTDKGTVSITAERYAVMITIIIIPVSLRFFANRLKKIPRPQEEEKASEKYKSASFLRLYPISAVTMAHILLFGISGNMNFFWFTVVLFIVFLFCKPSYPELESLFMIPAEKGREEEEEKEEEEEEIKVSGEIDKNQMTTEYNYPGNGQAAGK